MALTAMALLTGLAFHYRQTGLNAVSRPASSDFYKFYLSAQRVKGGLSMYWLVPPREQLGDACHPDTPDEQRQSKLPPAGPLTLGGDLPCLNPNLNPPVFMVIMLPLSMMPYAQAWWIWAGFSSTCALIGIWLLTGTYNHRPRMRAFWMLIGSAAMFAYYPTLANFSMGQMGTVLLPLISLAWLYLKRGKALYSGCWLGLAVGLKPFLGLLLLGLVVLRCWRALGSAVLVISGMCAAGACFFGADAYRDYASLAANVSWTASNWNGSWYGFFDRLFSGFGGLNWATTKQLSIALAITFSMITTGIWLTMIRQQNRLHSSCRIDALFMLGVPTSLLTSPLGWVYYFPLLILSGFIALKHSTKLADPRPVRLALLLLAVMASIPISLKAAPSLLAPTAWQSMDAWSCYTLTYCFIICAFFIRKMEAQR